MRINQLIVLMFAILLANVSTFALKSTNQKRTHPMTTVPNLVSKSQQNSLYFPDRIILKLRSSVVVPKKTEIFGVASLDEFVKRYSVQSITHVFPDHVNPSREGEVDLTRIFVMKYSSPIDAFKVADELSHLPEVQYAEPWFVYSVDKATTFTPNDPSYISQWALAKIQAASAWDVSHGDTDVVIGIVDTGVQLDHPDLAANIWINPAECGPDANGGFKQSNGKDDDGNGKIDDWHGWDFGGANYSTPSEDNNPVPTADNNAHGTHVAGIASACTDNGIGIASIGFKCRILAVKTSADNDTRDFGYAYIIAGYQGIVYAADMGAKVINISWGGYGASQFAQDIINYATNKGSLVVAAAGNDATSQPHYPSAFANVISVAATNTSDTRSSYSNYGSTVDVAAPGNGIYSTYFPSTYFTIDGTSMASPLVAGLAGLVKSHFPSYTPLQVGEQIRVTCDNISNSQLGKGRINAYKALTMLSPSLRMTNFVTSDAIGGNNNGILEPNETFTLTTTITNYLQATSSSAFITLSTTDPYVQVTSGNFAIGSVSTLDTSNNSAAPFQAHVANNAPPTHIVTFTLTISDGSYNDIQVFNVLVNPTLATHNVNNIEVTLTNNGRIGFLDLSNTYGNGFIFNGGNQLFEGGLLIGTSATKFEDVVRNGVCDICQDADFSSSDMYHLVTPGTISSQDGNTVFTDATAPAINKIGLQVKMYSYAFMDQADSNYVVLRYDIKNTSGASLLNLYVGLFFDWDMLPNYATNKTWYDPARNLGYAWDNAASNPVYCGARALDGTAGYRGLINNGSVNPSRSGKWSWLSGGVVTTDSVQDIHFVISSGPYSILNGATQMVGFAVLGGKNLAMLQTSADAALAKWNYIKSLVDVKEEGSALPTVYALKQNYPNPFNPSTTVSYDLPVAGHVSLRVYDVLGREVTTLVNTVQSAGRYTATLDASSLVSGVYYYRLTAGDFTDVKKLVLIR